MYRREFQAMEAYWRAGGLRTTTDPQVFERHIERLQAAGHVFGSFRPAIAPVQKISGSSDAKVATLRGPKRSFKWIAAAVLLGVVSTLLWFTRSEHSSSGAFAGKPTDVINEVQTRPGSRSKIVLPDGSQVWVNASSRLTYDQRFGRSHRNIQLDGEAYFMVEKNKDIPFVIQTKNVKIRVTGTIFNVRAYDNEERTETALVEGSVEVQVKTSPEKIYRLKPSQKLVINHPLEEPDAENISKSSLPPGKNDQATIELGALNYTPADSLLVETAWLYSTLAFNNESFAEVAQKMEKWYGVEIVFESSKLEKIRFSGTFTKESVKEALEALQYTANFKFRRNEDRIIIYH
ncbi:MAG TPA: FecR domain-containing protein [Phnomibacter sp.]|nr:FecR domain-containing protein [Phnomibacter sp.]